MTVVVNSIKGFFIGIALVLPGLSGSIFAVVVGLYDKILDSVNNFRKERKASFSFLWPIILGCVIGILSSTKVVLWICYKFPIPSYMFFVGLVIGSIPMIWRKMQKQPFKFQYLLLSILAFAALIFISGIGGNEEAAKTSVSIPMLTSVSDFFIVMFAGLFSCSLMAIPGVSGSVMLMVIRQYGTVYNAVANVIDFVKYLSNGDRVAAMNSLKSVALIIPFLLGAILGFIFIAKLLGYLLKNYEAIVYYGVAGLVASTIVTLFSEGVVSYAKSEGFLLQLIIGIIFVVIGYFSTIFFDKQENKI